MATINETSGVGLRRITFYLLDADGVPSDDESGADGYDGVHLAHAKSFTVNAPEVEPIVHTGDDYAFAQDYLPPSTIANGTITTGAMALDDDAALSGVNTLNIGDGTSLGYFTNNQGNEPDVLILVHRQALDTNPGSATYGSRRWQTTMIHRARLIPRGGSFDERGAELQNYNMIPTPATQYPWEVQFSDSTEGYEQALLHRFNTEFPLYLEAYEGDGSTNEFNTVFTPISTPKVSVWVNSTPATVSAVNTSTNTFTITTTPANGANVVALYETTSSLV